MRQLRPVMVKGLVFHFHQMVCNQVENFGSACAREYILTVLLTLKAVTRQVPCALFDPLT
jgi:hypothetical protein